MKNKTTFKINSFLAISLIISSFFLFNQKAEAVSLTSQLQLGSRGNEVSELQRFLGTNSMIYPANLTTGYFGPLTREAVIQFQIAHDLPAVGRVGPMTLAVLNRLLALGNTLDISSPQISSLVVSNVTNSGASINWTTNEGAKTKVFYSKIPLSVTEAEKSFSEPLISGSVLSDTSYTASHTFNLTSLDSKTIYYYIVESTDSYGNVSVSTQGTFITI